MSLPRCRVVVVGHRSETTLPRCLAAARQQAGIEVELVVVDNGSPVDPATGVEAAETVRWLRNPDNRGFAGACNQGAAGSDAEWLLFLNPDCFLPDATTLAELVRLAAADPRIGLLGARLLNADGSDQSASNRVTPTPDALFRRRAARADVWLAPGVLDVEAISGALMLMPRRLFESLGGFDEGYRLHCEDLDLCRRVLASGHRIGLAQEVRVAHLKGTSSWHRPFWVEWQKHRGMWRYFSKFDRATSPAWLVALVAGAITLHLPLAAARAWWRARRFAVR